MVMLTDCPACSYGNHEEHVKNFKPAPPGMMGGMACPCEGDCKDRWTKSREYKQLQKIGRAAKKAHERNHHSDH